MLIHVQTQRYPVSIYEVRAENPNTSYPDSPNFVPEGYSVVVTTPPPVYDKNTHRYEELSPVQDGTQWRQVWRVVELSEVERQKIRDAQATVIRKQRDALLAQSDWTQLPDAPIDTAAWASYRQALRDVPAQPGFPFDVVWPVKP